MEFIIILLLVIIILWLIAQRDDDLLDLKSEVEELKLKVNEKVISRLHFIPLKSIGSVYDTINDCFYEVGKDNILETEYRLSDCKDVWWEALSSEDLAIVNKIKNK